MAFKGKKRRSKDENEDCSDDNGSDSVGSEKAPPKKAAKKQQSEGTEEDGGSTAWELSKNRKVTVRKFKSMVLIDVREYYEKNGEELPTKKGISLTQDQWNVLRDRTEDIDAAIARLNE